MPYVYNNQPVNIVGRGDLEYTLYYFATGEYQRIPSEIGRGLQYRTWAQLVYGAPPQPNQMNDPVIDTELD